MASPPFSLDATDPLDSAVASTFPANERTFRDNLASYINTEHDINTGYHAFQELTTTAKNALTSPPKGMLVYDTTLNVLQINTGTSVSPTWTAVAAGVGLTNIFTVLQTINLNATAAPTAITGATLQLVQADGTGDAIDIAAFGNNAAIIGRRADNTNAAPTAIASLNEAIITFSARGYDGTAWSGSQGLISCQTAETWASGHHGTRFVLSVTPIGSTTLTDATSIENDGGICVPPTVTGGSKGPGTVNASTLYQAGTAVFNGLSSIWTPTDQSGGGLSLTTHCAFTQIGNMVFAFGTITYPSTADTHLAGVSLPVAAANQPYGSVPAITEGGGSNIYIRTQGNSNAIFMNASDMNITNATLSGLTLRFILIYPAT